MLPEVYSPRAERGCIAAMVLLLLACSASPSIAQDQWRQTVQGIVPVEEEAVTRALLDSVISVVRDQDISVRRAPQTSPTSLQEIEASLSDEGLAPSSATHVFITYRFSISGGTFEQEILDFHFIFRPEGGEEEDVPVLYLDLQDGQLYEKLLVERGTRLASNEATFLPFQQRVQFHSLEDQLTVVQVGNQIIRDTDRATAEKERILKTIRDLTYN